MMTNVRWWPFMPKLFPKTETEMVMSVDRDAGVLDLRVFATRHNRSSALRRLGWQTIGAEVPFRTAGSIHQAERRLNKCAYRFAIAVAGARADEM